MTKLQKLPSYLPSLRSALINISRPLQSILTKRFTVLSQVSQAQQPVAYDCQLLPLGNEHHLLQTGLVILQAEEKHIPYKTNVCHKKEDIIFLPVTSPNIVRVSQFFHLPVLTQQ